MDLIEELGKWIDRKIRKSTGYNNWEIEWIEELGN